MPSSNEQPFHAYAGNEPYIFISYAHKDSARVYPIIADWHNQGYRIWYDEGIDPGNEWPDEIAKALEHSSQFVIFVTKNSVASKNVRNEINYALKSNKKFLSVYLEDADLPPGMELQMGSLQAVMFYRMDPHSFQLKIDKTLPIETKENLSNLSIQENKPFHSRSVPIEGYKSQIKNIMEATIQDATKGMEGDRRIIYLRQAMEQNSAETYKRYLIQEIKKAL